MRNVRHSPRPWACLLACAGVLAACTPTIKVEAPDKPLLVRLDVNIKQEVLLRVERDVESASVAPAIPLAKRAGWIGERPDGYLGMVRDDTPDEIRDLVSRANDARVARYTEIAQKHNTGRETVEAVAGRKLIAASKTGEYVLTADNRWIRR